jgi:hypothetical protein
MEYAAEQRVVNQFGEHAMLSLLRKECGRYFALTTIAMSIFD